MLGPVAFILSVLPVEGQVLKGEGVIQSGESGIAEKAVYLW